jgi:hypothetical protein
MGMDNEQSFIAVGTDSDGNIFCYRLLSMAHALDFALRVKNHESLDMWFDVYPLMGKLTADQCLNDLLELKGVGDV